MRRVAALAAVLAAAAACTSSGESGPPGPVAVQAEVNAPALDGPAPVTHGGCLTG